MNHEKLKSSRTKVRTVDMARNIKTLFSSMKKYLPMLILSFVLLIFGVVISVISPTYTKELTNTISQGAVTKTIDLEEVARYGILLVSLFATSAVISYIANYILVTVAMRYSQNLRSQIIAKINRVPLRYFDTSSIGDLLSRLTNDVDMIGQSLQQSIGMAIQSIFMLVGVLIAMFVTSWKMAFVCLISIPLMAIFLFFIIVIAGPQFRRRQELLGETEALAEENYNGQMVLKLFNAEEKTNQIFDEENNKLQRTMFKAEICGGLMQPIMNYCSYLAYAAVCLAGGLLMNAGDPMVDIGTITAFLVYVNLFQSPLSQLAQAMNSFQSATASSQRVFEFLGEKELSDESGKKIAFTEENPVKGEVIFKHVSFGYDESRTIIHDFSASVKPGMKVAIVGPTGAGKTTMVNLLMRFYEVGSGQILIDGVDIKEMSREEIHNLFAMVLQDTWVYDGTLRENLSYNIENVTDEDYKRVIKAAHLTHFVRALPGGLDYVIQDDNSISGGQRQLITIARAMLKQSPLLILDEATSNVDTRTEEKIQEAMDRLSKGKTSFVIAHRLSTIKNADLILVMKDGNIIEQGTHDSLMQEDGFYASLYNAQFTLDQ